VAKPGPKATGDARLPMTLNVRSQLRAQIEAAADANNATVSAWLRWAAKIVLARRWRMPPSAKD
jgi:hypothetical protein